MEFTKRKLPKEAASELFEIAVKDVKPFVFMPAPVYVLMKENEKFVAIKAPLDFFTPKDLDRYLSFSSFFFSRSIISSAPFQNAGRKVRALLKFKPDPLPPASFEISDAILRTIGPLWSGAPDITENADNTDDKGKIPIIEPFFISIFTNEVCDPFVGELLSNARDNSIVQYEHAVFCSSLAVFLALHLGYCELPFLNALRLTAFEAAVAGKARGDPQNKSAGLEVGELLNVVYTFFEGEDYKKPLRSEFLFPRSDRTSLRLLSRLKRVSASLMNVSLPAPSIFGMDGFLNE